jgi:hypothetical protein
MRQAAPHDRTAAAGSADRFPRNILTVIEVERVDPNKNYQSVNTFVFCLNSYTFIICDPPAQNQLEVALLITE